MKVLNIGSLNIDYVYSVDHIVNEGETELSSGMKVFCGGKGLNQSIALARAGVCIAHAGIVGEDGDILCEACDKNGVDTRYIKKMPVKGGHTIIQVDKDAQNSIILYGGTNQMLTEEYIDQVLCGFDKDDYLILQNEVNLIDYIIEKAYEKKMKIVLNPSPFDEKLLDWNLDKVSLFMLNEIEGKQFTGASEPDEILKRLHEKYPEAEIVLTLGHDGSIFFDGNKKVFQGIYKVDAVDTTAAGDTFTGYYIASLINGQTIENALKYAAKASSIAVSRQGAVPSIPLLNEVEESFLKEDNECV